MLKCCSCKKILEEEKFSKKKCKRGYSSECKECHNIYNKIWYSRNRTKRIAYSKDWKTKNRAKDFITRNNITNENGIYDAVDTVKNCEICNITTKLVIDHCHKTSSFRGILCDGCNKGLGFFLDNIENLKNAIKYLKSK